MDDRSRKDLITKLKPFGAVPLEVEVEFHRMRMKVEELMSLEEGSVISTGKQSDRGMTVWVGGVQVAEAEWMRTQPGHTVRLVFPRGERG